jgi:hypothetical protein
MIIGNGLLSSIFFEYKDDREILIFASGVSNSSETRFSEFEREKKLLHNIVKNNPNQTLIYFSTCAFYDNYFDESLYLRHKRDIENWIKKNVKKFHILRIPQIIGSKNNNQLLGFLNFKIKNKQKFTLFDIERNIIDFEFLLVIFNYIISNEFFLNKTSNISYPANIRVVEIVSIFEKIHNVKGNYTLKNKHGSLKIENTIPEKVIFKLYPNSDNYFLDKIQKYYG